jgi:hypothetical protein
MATAEFTAQPLRQKIGIDFAACDAEDFAAGHLKHIAAACGMISREPPPKEREHAQRY